MTDAQIDNLFRYHAPTEYTAPKFAAIRAAEDAAGEAIDGALADPKDGDFNPVAAYEAINDATKNMAKVINRDGIHGLRRDVAIIMVGLARNAANEAVTDKKGRGRLIAMAKTKLQEARWLANGTAACGE